MWSLLTLPDGHRALAERPIQRGADVESTSDDCAEVKALLALDAGPGARAARRRGRRRLAGMTCVLATHAPTGSSTSTRSTSPASHGGPACAASGTAPLRAAVDWRDGGGSSSSGPGGSGRELCLVPRPVPALDCYRRRRPRRCCWSRRFPCAAGDGAHLGDPSRPDDRAPPDAAPAPPGGAPRRGAGRGPRRRGSPAPSGCWRGRPAGVAAGAVAALAARWAAEDA